MTVWLINMFNLQGYGAGPGMFDSLGVSYPYSALRVT